VNKEERKCIQKHYADKMIDYLPMLRAATKITQNQLAKKLDVTRSTMVAIESRKRPLQWYMYLALVLVFRQNDDSSKMLDSFELFDAKVIKDIT